MNLISRLGLGLIGALVPVMVLAIAPQNVTGITAVKEGEKVRVTWTQVANTDIKSYRIFYSHASILQNQGLYDDFETVDGSTNTHLLQNIPPVNELYVSVLAVNNNNEESPYFTQEAKVMLSMQPQTNSSEPILDTTPGNIVRVLSVEATSNTGVTIKFSMPVAVDTTKAVDAIRIENASGASLTVRRIIVQGSTMIVHTLMQSRGTVYTLAVGDGISGKGTNGTQIPLDPEQGPVLFTGHITGTQGAATSTAPVAQPATGLPAGQAGTQMDATQLRLVAKPDGTNTYTVEGAWQAPTQAGLTGYKLSQSTDGGKTYGAPSTIGAQGAAVKIPRVPAGTFSLRLQAIYEGGSVSTGITQSINLPGNKPTTNTQGNVTNTKPNTSTNLPSSGPALWLALAGSGAVTGAWKIRKARKAKKVSSWDEVEG
jgi:hypothetical protein